MQFEVGDVTFQVLGGDPQRFENYRKRCQKAHREDDVVDGARVSMRCRACFHGLKSS